MFSRSNIEVTKTIKYYLNFAYNVGLRFYFFRTFVTLRKLYLDSKISKGLKRCGFLCANLFMTNNSNVMANNMF